MSDDKMREAHKALRELKASAGPEADARSFQVISEALMRAENPQRIRLAEIDEVHQGLDDLGVPRFDEGRERSLWSRVLELKTNASQQQAGNTLASEICDELFQGLLSCHMNRHEVFEKLRNILPQQQTGEPVARLLHWKGPKHIDAPSPCARSFNELPYSLEDNHKYWAEGEALYTAPQPQPDWVPCSERLPTEDNDADPWSQIALLNLQVLPEQPMLMPVSKLKLLITQNVLDPRQCLWKPTGLTRPQPPEGV